MTSQPATPAQPVSAPSAAATAGPLTPAPRPKKNWAALKAVATLGVFVLGCVIGASGAHNTTTTTTVSPASCKTALDSAETIMHAAADGFGAVSKAFEASARFDAAGIQAQLAPENAANATVAATMPGYTRAATDCRAH